MSPAETPVGDLRPIYQIMRRINLGVDVNEVLEAIAEGVAQAVGFEVAAISYLTRDLCFEVMTVAGNAEAREQLVGSKVPLAEMEEELELADQWGSLLFIPAERFEGAPTTGWIPPTEPVELAVASAESETQANRWQPEDTLRSPLRCPKGELLGLLAVDMPSDGMRPDAARRELLEMYADLAGIALNNARRASELEEQVRLAGAVDAIQSNASRSLEIGHIIEGSVETIASALGADVVWLRAFDGETDLGARGHGARFPPDSEHETPSQVVTLVARSARTAWAADAVVMARMDVDGRPGSADRALAPTSETVEDLERVPVAGGAAGWVRRRRSTKDEIDGEQRQMLDFLQPSGARSTLMAPLGAGPDCLGYLVALRRDDHVDWSPHEVEAAGQIARNLGQAVLNARLLEREHLVIGQLEALDRYKSDLISTVSHELRTPLTAIAGHLEIIEDNPVAAPANSFHVVRRSLGRVLTLIDDLLTLKKVSDADTPSGEEMVDVHQVAVDAASSLRLDAQERGVTLSVLPRTGPLMISGVRNELERVALNLISNAVKYTPSGGAVEVSTEGADRLVRLIVHDTGMGISKADQEELFGEFFRSTNPEALALPGTGLGLSIVRRIVQRHGGSILLESDLGEGSTFTVRLPLSHT